MFLKNFQIVWNKETTMEWTGASLWKFKNTGFYFEDKQWENLFLKKSHFGNATITILEAFKRKETC